MELEKILEALTPEIVEKFKSAIELGKWPDGKKVSKEQLEICMQAVIAFEHSHVEEHERTGYVPPKHEPCETDHPSQSEEADIVQALKWKNDNENDT